MNVKIHIHNKESGLSRPKIIIGAFFGITDSIVEILSFGYVSIDLRYQYAYHCACGETDE